MNKLLNFFCVIIFIAAGCSIGPQKSDSNQGDQVDSLDLSIKESVVAQVQTNLSETERKKSVQGLWAMSPDANISFRLKGDSLFFFEDPNPIYFEIKQDSFIYYIEGEKYFNKIIKLQSDSIVFIENGQVIRLYNRESK